MIRILIVDGTAATRSKIRAVLESDPALKVIGEAGGGREAFRLCRTRDPDIVAVSFELTESDGEQVTRRIMSESPRPVLMLTDAGTVRDREISFRGIEAGAVMVLAKPEGETDGPAAKVLIETVKAMAHQKVVRRRWDLVSKQVTPAAPPPVNRRPGDIRVVAIGASTGGPPMLREILHCLSPDFPAPILVVQHISSGFIGGLASWLDAALSLRVKPAEHNERLMPGTVYLPVDGKHLVVAAKGLAALTDSPPRGGHRPSIGVLFDSVARRYGRSALGVLLTGMGADGAEGLRAIRDAGGHTLAQDEASSIVFGMPKEAIRLGGASEVLAGSRLGERIAALVDPAPGAR